MSSAPFLAYGIDGRQEDGCYKDTEQDPEIFESFKEWPKENHCQKGNEQKKESILETDMAYGKANLFVHNKPIGTR
jgi:hypothetical protein